MPSRTIRDGKACFTTHVVRNHTPIFCDHSYFSVVCESLTWCRRNTGLQIFAYVIMPDHMHLLTDVTSPENLHDILTRFRRFTALELHRRIKCDRVAWALNSLACGDNDQLLWESGFHPVDASREDIFDQKRRYIHENPVRRAFVRNGQDWAYSSARNYGKLDWCPMEIDLVD